MNSDRSHFFVGLAVLSLPWIAVMGLRELGPITYEPLSDSFVLFLFAFLLISLVFYICGFSITASMPKKKCPDSLGLQPSDVQRRYFTVLYVSSLLFVCLSFFDFLVVKGAGFSEIVELREQEHITGPRNSLIGALTALLSGAPPILFALTLLREDPSRKRRLTVNYVVAFGFFAMFLSGGRNAFFIGLLFIVVFRYFFAPDRPLLNADGRRITLILGVTGLALAIGYSMYLFIERAAYTGIVLDEMISVFSLNYGLSIASSETENVLVQSLYTIYVFLVFYATHALNYISDYFKADYSPTLMGAYIFPQLARLIDVGFGTTSFLSSREALLVNGAYLTLPGSLFLDFGVIGAIVIGALLCFSFGALIARPQGTPLIGKIVLSYLVVAFVFSPIYGVFGMANGFSMIFLIFLLLVISIIVGLIRSAVRAERIKAARK